MDPLTRARDLGRRYFDGLLAEPELHELQALLRGNPDAADAFARLARLEGGLAELFAREQDIRRESRVLDAIGRQGRPRRWLGWAVRLAVAACLLVAVGVPLLWWLARPGDGPDEPRGTKIVSGMFEHS